MLNSEGEPQPFEKRINKKSFDELNKDYIQVNCVCPECLGLVPDKQTALDDKHFRYEEILGYVTQLVKAKFIEKHSGMPEGMEEYLQSPEFKRQFFTFSDQ
jgi:hypothetical protein